MADRSCPAALTCPCSDFPVRNLSSEGDDPITFPVPGYPPIDPPNAPADPVNLDCNVVCTVYAGQEIPGFTAQELAELCAAYQALVCSHTPPPPPPGVTPKPAPLLYVNRAQTGTATCFDGSVFSFPFPAGLVISTSQAQADKEAKSLANSKALQHRICLSDLTNQGCRDDGTVELFIRASGAYVDAGILGAGVNQWQITSGALPDGLTLKGYPNGPEFSFLAFAGNTLVLEGIPTTPGVFAFTLAIRLPNQDYMAKQYIVEVLPNATKDTAITQPLAAPPCAAGKIQRTLIGPTPAGTHLSQDITGTDQITGTPTTESCCAFTIVYT